MDQFKGVFPAAITPMLPDGGLNEDAYRRVLEFNIEAGAHGFWLAGGTGESVLLEDDENRRIAELAVDVCRDKAITIQHVGAITTRRAAALAEHAASVGSDAICCVPTFFYPRSDAEVVEHYRAVAAAADLPFFCYNLPQCTGVEITEDLMKNLQDSVPQLTGLKHSSSNFSNIRAFSEMGLAVFTGSSYWMLPAMTTGAVGCIDGPPGLAPDYWVAIFEAFHAGDLDRAGKVQAEASQMVEKLITLFEGSRYIAICKLVLSHRLGIECGDPRLPAMPLTDEQRSVVLDTVAQLRLEPAAQTV